MDGTYDNGVVFRDAEERDVTLHLPRSRRRRDIYAPPIRINCARRRRKYVPKDIGARYYDANERSNRAGIHALSLSFFLVEPTSERFANPPRHMRSRDSRCQLRNFLFDFVEFVSFESAVVEPAPSRTPVGAIDGRKLCGLPC